MLSNTYRAATELELLKEKKQLGGMPQQLNCRAHCAGGGDLVVQPEAFKH